MIEVVFVFWYLKIGGTIKRLKTDISGPATLCFLLTAIALILSCRSIESSTPSASNKRIHKGNVPVVPNEAVIIGTVKAFCMASSGLEGISPEQVIYKLVISVEETKDVKGYPNLLKSKKGLVLTFFTKERLSVEVFGKRIKGRVKYMGDERGGRFWINNIEILK